MPHPKTTLSAPLVAFWLASTLAAQDDLAQKVQRLVSEADQATLTRAYEIAHQLSELEGQEDAIVKAIGEATQKAKDHGRLAAARALLDIGEGESHAAALLDALRPVCKSDDVAARAAALSLIGKKRFTARSKTLTEAQALLAENALSDIADPKVRLAAGRSLWEIGTDEQRSQARGTLTAFLASTDRGLRTQGALMLAEINQVNSDVRKVLNEVSGEPTDDGRLAKSYLMLEGLHREYENKLMKLADRSLQTDAKPGDELAVLREIITKAKRAHIYGDKIDDQYLVTEAAKGIAHALDRHTTYFTSEEFQKFFFDLNREYGGIGAFVNFDQDEVFSIVRPIYSGPAYRAGLKSGDKILEVDGWETTGHTSDEIIAKLKGQPGTKVTLKYARPGLGEAKEVSLVREEIQVPSVTADLLPGKIGYVECITFGANSADEMRKAIEQLKERGAQGIVLDLRNNTGGYLLAARDIVELFVPGKKLVVYTESRVEPRQNYNTRDLAVFPDLPLAVLVNEYSASASEITAGALQDLKRAVVVGKRSYGKGSVQTFYQMSTDKPEPFEDTNKNEIHDEWEPYTDANKNGKYDVGARLKMTIARYFLPSGRCLHKDVDEKTGKVLNPDWGIRPDREVEFRENSAKEAWKNAELYELLQKDVFRKYVRERLDQNKELFLQLAEGDQGDTSKYPDFEKFYEGLQTKLPKDDIRKWIRYAMRDEVADLRGRPYPGGRALGDFQEDGQLQEAMRALFEKLGKDIKAMPEFGGNLLKLASEQPEKVEKKKPRG